MSNKIHPRPDGFLTFVCALVPGAAQMYMGLMIKGLTLLGTFFGGIALASILNGLSYGYYSSLLSVPPALFCIVIYVYSFFDAWRTRRQIMAGLAPEDDCELLQLYRDIWQGKRFNLKVSGALPKWIGVALIVLGGLAILERLGSVGGFIDAYYETMRLIRSLLLPAALVVVGLVLLMRGARRIQDQTECHSDSQSEGQ